MSDVIEVRPINKQILNMDGTDNLIPQIIPAIGTIVVPTYRPGDRQNELSFGFAGQTSGRVTRRKALHGVA